MAAALPTRPGGRQLTGALLVIGGVIAMLWLLGFTFLRETCSGRSCWAQSASP